MSRTSSNGTIKSSPTVSAPVRMNHVAASDGPCVPSADRPTASTRPPSAAASTLTARNCNTVRSRSNRGSLRSRRAAREANRATSTTFDRPNTTPTDKEAEPSHARNPTVTANSRPKTAGRSRGPPSSAPTAPTADTTENATSSPGPKRSAAVTRPAASKATARTIRRAAALARGPILARHPAELMRSRGGRSGAGTGQSCWDGAFRDNYPPSLVGKSHPVMHQSARGRPAQGGQARFLAPASPRLPVGAGRGPPPVLSHA